MQNGSAYRHQPLVRTTTETGFSYWPTPKASQDGTSEATLLMALSGKCEMSLMRAVKIAKYLPTPVRHDGNRPSVKSHANGLWQSAARGQLSTNAGQLNPMWVEWLMGFPIGHTDCEDSEMR
jgi:DNA (cytosine-5)-methyltransferase 1